MELIIDLVKKLEITDEKLKFNYTIIDNNSAIPKAIENIKESKVISVDIEGDDLSRKGQITIIQVKTEKDFIFIFDAFKLEKKELLPLFEVLESTEILKLVFDFRNDVDALLHQFDVRPKNLLDIQIVEFFIREELEKKNSKQILDWFKNCVTKGKINWYSLYLPGLKTRMKQTNYKYTKELLLGFQNRPLTDDQIYYCCLDVYLIFKLYKEHEPIIFKENLFNKLKILSENYCAMYSKLDIRHYNTWECNNIIPIQIFIEDKSKFTRTCKLCKLTLNSNCYNKNIPDRCLRCWFNDLLNQREKQFEKKNDSDEYYSCDYSDSDNGCYKI